MNPPSPFSYVIGNVVLAPFLMLVCGLVIWQWWQGGAPPMAAIIAFFVASSAAEAMNRVQRYREWKRQWDALGDAPPRLTLAQWIGRIPGLRLLLIGVIWFVVLVIDAGHRDDLTIHLACLWALVGLPLMVMGDWFLRFRRKRRARRTARDAAAPVSLLLSLPRASPTRGEATQALPDYCKRLLG